MLSSSMYSTVSSAAPSPVISRAKSPLRSRMPPSLPPPMEKSKETPLASLSEGSTKEAKPSPEKAVAVVVAVSGNLTAVAEKRRV